MKSRLLWIVTLVIASLFPGAAFAQAFGTIAFSPDHPTTNDAVTVTLSPAVGWPDFCSLGFSVQGNRVYIGSIPTSSCAPGATNTIVIGELAAGTYQVTWNFVDNFNNVPLPTGILTVIYVPAPIPVLSPVVAFMLVCCLALLGLYARRSWAHEP